MKSIVMGNKYLQLANKKESLYTKLFNRENFLLEKVENYRQAGFHFYKGAAFVLSVDSYLQALNVLKNGYLYNYTKCYTILHEYVNMCNNINYCIDMDNIKAFQEFIINNIENNYLSGKIDYNEATNKIEYHITFCTNLKLLINDSIITFFDSTILNELIKESFTPKRIGTIYELIGINYKFNYVNTDTNQKTIQYYKLAVKYYNLALSKFDVLRLFKQLAKFCVKSNNWDGANSCYESCYKIALELNKIKKAKKYFIKYIICSVIYENNFSNGIEDKINNYMLQDKTFNESKEYKLLREFINEAIIVNNKIMDYIK